MGRFGRPGWLVVWTPLASAILYFVWIAVRTPGLREPCGDFSQGYGLIPFFAVPPLIVALRARLAGRPAFWLAFQTTVLTALALLLVWSEWFRRHYACGE